MHHYLGFIWDSSDGAASAAAQRLLSEVHNGKFEWRRVFNDEGLVVFERLPFSGALEAKSLANGGGVVLGRLFRSCLRKDTVGSNGDITERETQSIIESQGRFLLTQFWGGYVAFLNCKSRRTVQVIRDCSGRIPCYRVRHRGVDIIFSDMADLADLHLPALRIDFKYLAAFACSSQLQIRSTGFDEITELLAGDCFTVCGKRRSQNCLWDPVQMFGELHIDSFEVAAAEVRSTMQHCVTAWAAAFGRIAISLSGGLDSAVVLGCLRNARRADSLTCINRYGTEAVEDERRFARAAALAAGVSISEFPFFNASPSIDDTAYRRAVIPKPTIAWAFGNLDIEGYNQIARQCGADTIWTGQGGDHLFMQVRSAWGARDYIELNGLKRGLLPVIRDSQRLSKQPLWRTLGSLTSKKAAINNAAESMAIPKLSFVTSEARSAILPEYSTHPWVLGANHLSPGRQFHVAALSEVLNRHRPFPGVEAVYEHHPMLSQPLVELCLKIPSYVHLQAGIPRAVERAAFKEVVPADIIARKQKGQSTMSMLEVLHRSEAYVAELLMDGILVREKILDRALIEPFLHGRRPMQLGHTFPMIACIAAELWAQNRERTVR
jgi:asparagine synthase (glutamine-hydrolysing)